MRNSGEKDTALAGGGLVQTGDAQQPEVGEQPPLPGWIPAAPGDVLSPSPPQMMLGWASLERIQPRVRCGRYSMHQPCKTMVEKLISELRDLQTGHCFSDETPSCPFGLSGLCIFSSSSVSIPASIEFYSPQLALTLHSSPVYDLLSIELCPEFWLEYKLPRDFRGELNCLDPI